MPLKATLLVLISVRSFLLLFQDEIKTLEDNFHSNDKEYSFKVSDTSIRKP